jgi:stage II sporulation protein M
MKPFRILWQNRGYISFAFVLFLVGIFLGYLFSGQLSFLSSAIENLRRLGEQVHDKNAWSIGLLIFENNLRVSLILLVLGVLLAVPSILGIVMNGALIGFLFALMGKAKTVSLPLLFAFGILPHGLFEIPAFIIAGAFGMKTGYVLLRPLVGMTRLQSFGHVWKEVLWIAPVVVILLFFAAGIESFITPVLLQKYVM